VRVDVAQGEAPESVGTPPIEALDLSLPDGVRLSPSFADGLGTCSPAQIGLGTDAPVTCPNASRIGEASLSTPLLPEPLHGFIYVAAPRENPSGSLFAIYLVVADGESRGVLIKLPGRLDLDPVSGQITVRFGRLPQLPFDHLDLRFRGGSRAPLLSSGRCGGQPVTASVSSWARPEQPVALSDSIQTDQGAGGEACLAEHDRPFAPEMLAGTIDPSPGASSPFVFRLARSDRDQKLESVSATLPPGLSADVSGIPRCPEAASAASECPASSRLGRAIVATGAGPDPLYLEGSIYLARPLGDAPFSLLVVVPGLAGPFDLGTLSSRIAVSVDPRTAQLRLAGEPLPRILGGVPVDLRSLRLELDRPGLITNPTSCDPLAVTGAATSRDGATSPLNTRFQLGGCDRLPFGPRVGLRFNGTTARNGHPTLIATIRPRAGDANLAAAAITVPPGGLIDPANLTAICSDEELEADTCPAGSRQGSARAWSPSLAAPLEGALHLVEGRGRYPDLALSLHGPIDLTLRGHLKTPRGRIRAEFDQLPDIPLSRLQLTLTGGTNGLLLSSAGLCRSARRAKVALAAHNGEIRDLRPRVAVACTN
jgi:hypothetical protein